MTSAFRLRPALRAAAYYGKRSLRIPIQVGLCACVTLCVSIGFLTIVGIVCYDCGLIRYGADIGISTGALACLIPSLILLLCAWGIAVALLLQAEMKALPLGSWLNPVWPEEMASLSESGTLLRPARFPHQGACADLLRSAQTEEDAPETLLRSVSDSISQ